MGRWALRAMVRRNGPKNSWVVEQLDLGPDDRYLDVGCGPGLAVEAALGYLEGETATGVDASELSVETARRRLRSEVDAGRARFRVAPAHSLPFDDATFTAASAVNTLGFWPDPEAGVREIHRVLAPGGRFVVALRLYDPDAGRLDPASFGAVEDDLARVRNLLRHAGFEVVDARTGTHRETTAALVSVRPT